MAVQTVKATIDGQVYNLSYNGTTKKWEATITAPSTTSYFETNHKYGVSIEATDQAGNKTTKDRNDGALGSDLQIRVLEKIKPTIAITSPSSGAKITTAKPTIHFQLRDTGSGVKTSSLVLKIDGGSSITSTSPGMTVNSVAGGYDCEYTPQTALAQGSHTISIDVADNDGNASSTKTVTFTVDTVPPILNITNPSNGLITNVPSLTVSGSTNDATSTPVVVTIKLNGVDQGAVSVSNGNFSKAITLAEGSNTIVVKSTDDAGLSSSVTRTVTLDTKPPAITNVSIVPNPVDCGKTYVISVTVTD